MSRDIMFFRRAIDLSYDAINVMRPLHGKVYNVRIKDTLKDVLKSDDDIYGYVYDGYNKDCLYIRHRDLSDVATAFNIETFIPEGGTAPRFDATATIQNAMDNVKELECRMDEYMESRKNIENVYDELNSIFRRLDEIQSSIKDYTLKEYYQLNFSIR